MTIQELLETIYTEIADDKLSLDSKIFVETNDEMDDIKIYRASAVNNKLYL